MIRLACISLFALGLSATAGRAAGMSDWDAAVRKRCPTHHLEWTSDGSWDDFLAAFEQPLPQPKQGEILKVADYSHRCAAEVVGFSCEMSVNVDAMKRLGLLTQFVAWGCQHYRCREPALCDRTPPLSAKY
jgi:hypothetical protein